MTDKNDASNEQSGLPLLPDDEDILVFEARLDVRRNQMIKKFEIQMSRLASAYSNIESPTEDDATALAESQEVLRERLVIDLMGTMMADTDTNQVAYYTNLIQGTIDHAYVLSKVANDVVTQFEVKLENRAKSQGIAPEEFPQFGDAEWFLREVQLISKIWVVDTLLNGVGESVRQDRNKLVDALIQMHFPELRKSK